jgi:hypothetical protein
VAGPLVPFKFGLEAKSASVAAINKAMESLYMSAFNVFSRSCQQPISSKQGEEGYRLR